MPYISRYVQVLPTNPPNTPLTITHGLDNTDVTSVEIFPDGPDTPSIPFTWKVVDALRVTITPTIDVEGCWIVIRAL